MIAFVASCTKTNEELYLGVWRGEFFIEGKNVPFNFEVAKEDNARPRVYLLNGDEKAGLDSIYYRADSVVINIDIYDAILVGRVEGDEVKGYFRKNQSGKQGIPFIAKRDDEGDEASLHRHRFDVATTSSQNVDGKWSVRLISEKDGKETSRYTVGLFEQTENKVTGTILTTTGDYRFLEGVVDGDDLKLSAFSGSNPTLIEARITAAIISKESFYRLVERLRSLL